MSMSSCFFCKGEISPNMTIGHETVCSHCGRHLKACVNCRFYDESAYHECREAVEEHILDKRNANFCPNFMISQNGSQNKKASTNKEETIKRLKALFNEE